MRHLLQRWYYVYLVILVLFVTAVGKSLTDVVDDLFKTPKDTGRHADEEWKAKLKSGRTHTCKKLSVFLWKNMLFGFEDIPLRLAEKFADSTLFYMDFVILRPPQCLSTLYSLPES